MVILTLPALLLACTTLPPISAGPEVVVKEQAAVKPPPGHELYETLICLRERRADIYGRERRETNSIRLGMWVPIDRCLELSEDGWLRVVPGDCPVLYPPKVTSCD